MLIFEAKPVKLVHVNNRKERHGEDLVLAADLKIECGISAAQLDEMAAGLSKALFVKDSGAQGNLDIGEHPMVPRFAKMASVKWDEQYEGYTVNLAREFKSLDRTLHSAIIDKFSFAPGENGGVAMVFRIRANVDPDELGELCNAAQETVMLTLTPPEHTGETSKPRNKGPQADLVDDAEAERNRANAAAIAGAMQAGQGVTTDASGNVVAQPGDDAPAGDEEGDLPPASDEAAWIITRDDGARLLIQRDDGLYRQEVLQVLLSFRGWDGVTEEELNTIPDDAYTATLEFLIGATNTPPSWLTKAHGKAKASPKAKAPQKGAQDNGKAASGKTKDGKPSLKATKKTAGKRVVD